MGINALIIIMPPLSDFFSSDFPHGHKVNWLKKGYGDKSGFYLLRIYMKGVVLGDKSVDKSCVYFIPVR